MPFTYTPDVPKAQTPMNITQPQILENFKAISELVAVNHVDFNLDGIGFHNVTMMPNTTAPATPETTGITMYTAATGSPNPSEIFGQYPDASTVQISGSAAAVTSSSFCQFPSGLIMKWGTATAVSSQQGSITFPVGIGIPVFTTTVPYSSVTIITTPYPLNVSFALTCSSNLVSIGYAIVGTAFTSGMGPININWTVIGI